MSKYHKKKSFDERMLDIPACFGVVSELQADSYICKNCKYLISCSAHVKVMLEMKRR